jgi:hypothetical protein
VKITVHVVDGEQIEGDSDALSLARIGFPLRTEAGAAAAAAKASLEQRPISVGSLMRRRLGQEPKPAEDPPR